MEDYIYINDYLFSESNIESIIIPKLVETIGEGAFRNCTNLRKIKILSRNLNFIDSFAFNNCSYVNELIILAKNAPDLGTSAKYEGELEIYSYHPFGYRYGMFIGENIKTVIKVFVPFNNMGYDTEKWLKPLFNEKYAGFTLDLLALESEYIHIYVEKYDVIYMVRNNDINNPIPVSKDSGKFTIVNSNSDKIYDNELITIYSDSNCTNKIGEFITQYDVDSYIIDTVMGSTYSKSLFNTNIFDDEIVVKNSDMDVLAYITKYEYNILLAKINQLMKLLDKKK